MIFKVIYWFFLHFNEAAVATITTKSSTKPGIDAGATRTVGAMPLGCVAADNGMGKHVLVAADTLGEILYKILIQEVV